LTTPLDKKTYNSNENITKRNSFTLGADDFLAALVVDNTIPVQNKYHIGFITSTASFLGIGKVRAIRGGTTSSVGGYTVISITTYSTF